MMDDVFTLFDDYAARFARGERPDAGDYLTRAGGEAEELATLIDRYLERASPPAPDEDSRALAAAWIEGQPPLLELRTRRGLRRDEVVDALMAALKLDSGKRGKVKGYYHRLETGLLATAGVDGRVWDALATTLRARAQELRSWRPKPMQFESAYYRADADAIPMPSAVLASPDPAPAAEPDEVDRLFTGAS